MYDIVLHLNIYLTFPLILISISSMLEVYSKAQKQFFMNLLHLLDDRAEITINYQKLLMATEN